MFDCILTKDKKDTNDDLPAIISCEISMQNQLALLDTCLLKTYSVLDPRIRVLASIIKLWAKRRGMNNPSHHTLSTYGYLIMMLHFLTFYNNYNGLQNSSTHHKKHNVPLLPNLQWIDALSLSDRKHSKSGQRHFHDLYVKPNQQQYSNVEITSNCFNSYYTSNLSFSANLRSVISESLKEYCLHSLH
jgi:DNA polymerase sigma